MSLKLLPLFFYVLFLFWSTSCTQEPQVKEVEIFHPVVDSLPVIDSLPADSIQVYKPLNDSLNQLASLIAGMCDSSSFYTGIIGHKAYAGFHHNFSARWQSFDSIRLGKLRNFHDTVLSDKISEVKTLFYPFSGPDYLYAGQFFPEAKRYILVGLEPVGNPNSLIQQPLDSLQNYFSSLSTALDAILNFSFFRTNSMEKDLRRSDLDGVVHLLFLFLKRNHQDLLTCKAFVLDSAGNKQFTQNFDSLKRKLKGTAGLEIQFQDTTGCKRELDYHCVNLSDQWLRKKPGFLNYLKQDSAYITYLKGASYLLHKAHFSRIRQAILNSSTAVVQDDSGISLNYFLMDKRKWRYTFYGNYTQPIPMFRKHFQSDLDSLYNLQGSQPLGFGIGYNFKDRNSNLMIAVAQ